MSETIHICAICKVPATQVCGSCKNVFYCSRDHQKRHWKEGHKNNCVAFKIVEGKLVAIRDIPQNEVILKEDPLMVAPEDDCCLGCNKHFEGKGYVCTHCNLKLCSKRCQEAPYHRLECAALGKSEFKEASSTENFDASIVGPLRCLLMNKPKYELLLSLPKKELKDPERIKTTLVPIARDILKLNYTEEDVLKVCSLFDFNSMSIVKEGEVRARGIYPIASQLKHDCRPNTRKTFREKNQLYLLSTVPIAKGEDITTSYTESIWGTLARREHLKETRGILCECKRCTDKTELGTYLGSIFCSKCKKPNDVECPKVVSTDPLNPTALWKCEVCDHTIPGRQMTWGNNQLKNEINRIGRSGLVNLEKFLVKYQETLHPKNYHSLVIKYTLSQIYSQIDFKDLTDEVLERQLDVCHELLEVFDELEPGSSRIRGSLLYDLQAALVMQAKREFNQGKRTRASTQDALMESLIILKEASEILSLEPDMKTFLQEKLDALAKEIEK